MRIHSLNCIIFFLIYASAFSQNKIDLKAIFDVENKQIKISQTIQYYNTTNDQLKTIYLNNWNNSYSTKSTALAIRIADEYNNDFHLAKDEDRGYSTITSIKQNNEDLIFSPLENQIDILKVELKQPLKSNASYKIHLEYLVKLPNAKFTQYGINKEDEINLRYWYITPAIYNGTWQYYSNKNLDDLFVPKSDVTLEIQYPKDFVLTSELDVINTSQSSGNETIKLEGKNRINDKLFLNKISKYKTIQDDSLSIISNINDENLEVLDKVLITEKVKNYIIKNLGEYPHKKLLLSQIEYDKDPVYGLNSLPSFLKTYPKTFIYELKLLKIVLHNYLENTLLLNPRKEQWLIDGIQVYYLIKYIEDYYPDMKFLGRIADFWGVRSFHAADLMYNDKYNLSYMLMVRSNRDQPLSMAKDSLLKFNKNIANKYKAGIGLKYLDDFIDDGVVENSIQTFLKENKTKQTSIQNFENLIKSKTEKNIDWFFEDYVKTRKKIDFKIKKVKKTEDSITLTIKNKSKNKMPISLYALNNDSIISKTWVENINHNKTVTIPRLSANKLALNYNNTIPEYNLRDNWKSLKGFFFNNKPLQFRLFQDVEDPYYNQLFFMPIIEFNNIYDGITLGGKIYNKTVLRKLLNYKIAPRYSFKSRSLTGSASIFKLHYVKNKKLHTFSYGIGGGYSSYADGLFVTRITPSIQFLFREKNDFRSNKKQSLTIRHVNINRDKDINNIFTSNEPNYSVFNMRYINSNDNLINFSKWYTDFQIGKKFTKLSINYEFRKLFQSNRQLNIRAFAGTFLNNKTDSDSDFFSFALDRPTDYLFDYNYLGRSEEDGIFSQQYIEAEGGFKSRLESPFANQWITTVNTSTTLWRYVLAYGDIGFVKNKFNSPNFVYDSGIRLNLVTDYFEIYFPLYSNLGWEVGQPNYDQKIRFKFTADPQTLLGLFRRRWF